MIRLFLFWLWPAIAAAAPLSALTEGERCFMDCRREAHSCSADCRSEYPKDSREAFECDLDCGDRIDRLCRERCDLSAPDQPNRAEP